MTNQHVELFGDFYTNIIIIIITITITIIIIIIIIHLYSTKSCNAANVL